MKDIRTLLPPLASDTAGACSMLFETGGLTVIHDAAGSMEVFTTFEEQRSLEHCRTVVSQLSQLEAVTGNDQILLDKITTELTSHPAPFAAIVGTPVPFTICIDLEGIAAEAEAITDTPVFAVTAGGFELYHQGAGEALQKLLERTVLPPRPHQGFQVNLLGAFPMDCSSAELEGMRAQVLACGASKVSSLTMNGSMEEISHAAEADCNIVISMAGLPVARWLQRKYHIPYVIGVPFVQEDTRWLLHPEELPSPSPAHGKKVLILGDAVFAVTLAAIVRRRFGCDAVAGIENSFDDVLDQTVPRVLLDTEAQILEELSKPYDLIVGDPLYQQLLPHDSKTVFLSRPHQALSSRLYRPAESTLEILLHELEEQL